MRLLSLEISGFRGFPFTQVIDLDADAVVIVGANGHGKTSMLDAILWALSGRIPRLQNNDSRLVSMYSESGQARVAVGLKNHSGQIFIVTRSFDGTEGRISLESAGRTTQGPAAEGMLLELLWPDASNAADPAEALAAVLTRSVYLQQDLIRQFVEAASDQDRFVAVSEMVGAGRVTELQASLERAKKAWSTTTNQRMEEARAQRERLTLLETRLAASGQEASRAANAVTAEEWDAWWSAVAEQKSTVQRIEPGARDASLAIGAAIKELDALSRSTERRLQMLNALQEEVSSAVVPQPNVDALRSALAEARREAEGAKQQVSAEQTRLAEVRRQQSVLRDQAAQLRTLATIALQHLDEHCPVCAQTYDRDQTRKRLEALVSTAAIEAAALSGEAGTLPQLLSKLSEKEQKVSDAELAVRSAEHQAARVQADLELRTKRIAELGLSVSSSETLPSSVATAAADSKAMLDRCASLLSTGESLALRLGQASNVAVSEELRREAEALRKDLVERESAIAARNKTGDEAQTVIEALREASSKVVEQRLTEISPLLQSIYARIDPHPAFRLVSFLSRVIRGKGHLATVISDPIENKDSDSPASVLSSSQVNALAVAVFLSLNLGIPAPPLAAAVLDDPLQSLDDINLLGLVDLLRRSKDRRQLLVSTHDARFGALLARKLRPSTPEQRTVVVELEGWSRRGPNVAVREIKSDPVPLRLVSTA
jgi:DNA repair exonuclease SbcCD ATPase subunit